MKGVEGNEGGRSEQHDVREKAPWDLPSQLLPLPSYPPPPFGTVQAISMARRSWATLRRVHARISFANCARRASSSRFLRNSTQRPPPNRANAPGSVRPMTDRAKGIGQYSLVLPSHLPRPVSRSPKKMPTSPHRSSAACTQLAPSEASSLRGEGGVLGLASLPESLACIHGGCGLGRRSVWRYVGQLRTGERRVTGHNLKVQACSLGMETSIFRIL